MAPSVAEGGGALEHNAGGDGGDVQNLQELGEQLHDDSVYARDLKQRGYYSDILSEAAAKDASNQATLMRGARADGRGQHQHVPKVRTFADADVLQTVLQQNQSANEVYASQANLAQQSSIPLAAMEPKVMIPFKPGPGKTPRRIEIERKKRSFAAQNIGELLLRAGIDSADLLTGADPDANGDDAAAVDATAAAPEGGAAGAGGGEGDLSFPTFLVSCR